MNRSRSAPYHLPQDYSNELEWKAKSIIDQLHIRHHVCCPKSLDSDFHDETCILRKNKKLPRISSSSTLENTNDPRKLEASYGLLNDKEWFLRLAVNTPVEKVEKVLLESWKIPKPQFILSIIGGVKYFKMSNQLEANLINGVIEIIKEPNGWLITNGYNSGIVQVIGQAISKYKLSNFKKTNITAIGICKWGCIKDLESIINQPLEETMEKASHTTYLESRKTTTVRHRGEWDLAKHHSHYLMLDDGTRYIYDTRDYRTHLITHMARLNNDDDVFVPVVTIVVEGGKETIKSIYSVLKSSIPVVIIDGSGRAADFFSRWLLLTKDVENDRANEKRVWGIDELIGDDHELHNATEHHEQHASNTRNGNRTERHLNSEHSVLPNIFAKHFDRLYKDIKDTFLREDKSDKSNKTKEQDENTLLTHTVMFCLQPAVRTHINVFNLNSEAELSEAIIRSICRSREKVAKLKKDEIKRGRSEKTKSQSKTPDEVHNVQKAIDESNARQEAMTEGTKLLKLAMRWNCIQVAREFIFQNSLNSIRNPPGIFVKALKDDLPAFVHEFLKLGFDPTVIFFPEKKAPCEILIGTLYTPEIVETDKTHLKYFIEARSNEDQGKIYNIESLNTVLTTIIGDYMHELYFETPDDEEQYVRKWGLKKNLQQQAEGMSDDNLNESYSLTMIGRLEPYDYILRDLFLWAILVNRTDMAKVFLCFMKYRICPALIATKILKKYYTKADYGHLKDDYLEKAKYFEQYAIDCLAASGDHNIKQACEIILQQNELYGYVTCLQVASDAKDKLFIAAPCCSQAMDNIWYDKVDPDQKLKRRRLGLFFGIISFGLLAPLCVKYQQNKQIKKGDIPTPPDFEKNGITYNDSTQFEYSQPDSESSYSLHNYYHKFKKFHNYLACKIAYQFTSYIFFLILFSYVLLFKFEPPTNASVSIDWTEILTIILVTCILIEEIHCFITQDSLSFFGRIEHYFRDQFKVLTVISLTLFYIGLILRFANASTEANFVAARIVMAIDVELWWLRSLSFIIILPALGPHIVAITKMLSDLLSFLIIIAIVMIGYGVASRSMTYYPKSNGVTDNGNPIDTSFSGKPVFANILYPVYYLLHSQFGNERTNLDSNPDAGWSIANHVLLAIHMIFVNILLTNLLIAMFSKRFDQVYEDTKNIWLTQRYLFTREYFTRSPFLPPLSLIYDIYYLFYVFIRFVRRKYWEIETNFHPTVFKIIPTKAINIKKWYVFEKSSTDEYAHEQVKALLTKSDSDSNDKTEDVVKSDVDSSNALNGLKQVQKDLAKLNVTIDEMNGQLEVAIAEKGR
ncbi:unnamed protein product [Rotaria socialis]|uniref:Uncharacterized protein n=1 Tax=Rotaria socialis TaxID=392032 RepID=A0A819AG61_9BILA|nr:unnamed protein product [Rotaria socialis]CAF4850136.1 unnamed protein product [Rotaria socialis]